MERVIIVLVVVWPIVGLTVLYLVGRIGANKGRGVLPPSKNLAEFLVRMYLWPLVWWRAQRSRDQRGND